MVVPSLLKCNSLAAHTTAGLDLLSLGNTFCLLPKELEDNLFISFLSVLWAFGATMEPMEDVAVKVDAIFSLQTQTIQQSDNISKIYTKKALIFIDIKFT